MARFEKASAWWMAIIPAVVFEFAADFVPAQQPATAPSIGSFARLSEPAVAEKLKLTDQQRSKIAALRIERTEALSQAAPADRAKVLDDFEQKLAALLSEEQRAGLVTAPADVQADIKLRFNFRFQRWSDVLEWFAEQAQLSLVLDTPPPGTFNYSDGREYTVSEALDLLNGVLSTKGFTLIRREKMLLVVNAAEGIPETLVPRIELADLEKRGKFELVSMLFKIGERNVDDVMKEIGPLLGPRGKSLPLPKTKQVLVTDTAGVMRAIHAVIESMPQPEAAQEPSPPEKPELVVYPLKSVDPDAAIKVLEALMPEGRFVRDPKANQLSAYATPSQQAAVKRVLEQMQASNVPPEQQARFEVYMLEEGDPKQALATLQPLVPNAKLSVDATSKKLAAWGSPADHEILKKAIGQLRGGGADDDRQLEVYRLSKVDPATATVVLQSLVPRARLSVDPPTRSIVALASLADQKIIAATLNQLEPRQRDPNAPELRFYILAGPAPPNLVTVLQTMAPKAQVSVDNTARRLTVVATPTDHKIVQDAIAQFQKAAPDEEKRQLVLYPVSAAQRKRFQLVLQDLTAEFPTVKVLTDAEPGELAVWARPAEHKVIADVIEKLKQQAPAEEAYRLVAYSIKTADPTSVLSVLQNLFPATKVFLDPKTKRIVAWTRAAEHEAIKSLVEQVDVEATAESKNQLMIYPFTGADPTAAITTLKILVPEAILTSDTKAGTIVAWARKADHALIAPALERMQPNSDPKRRPHVVAYAVGASDPNTLSPLITALVPTARVVPNAKNGTLAVWASPEDHETIRLAIEEMTKNGALDSAAQVIAYPLKIAEPTSVVGMMQTLFPASRMTFDAKNKRLLIFGRPAEQQQIKTTLEQMDAKPGAEANRQLAVFPITGTDPTATITMLKSLVPETTLTSDIKAGTIVAWGPQAELDQIAPAIERMQPNSDPKRRPHMVAYAVGASDPTVLAPLVTALVPTARAVPNVKTGTIAVWATPEDHVTIRSAIEEMTAKRSDDNAAKVVVYSLKSMRAASAIQALQPTVPEARLGMGAGLNSRKLVAFARPADHAIIRGALEELDQEEMERNGPVLKTYPIAAADPTTMLGTLQAMFAARSEVRFSLDAKTNKIVAMATPAVHETIRGVIEELERGSQLDTTTKLEVHPLRNADPDVVMQVLNNLVTKQSSRVLLSVDAKARQLIAVAPPEQQARILEAIERLQTASRELEVFQLEIVEPLTAELAIEKLFSEAVGGSSKAANAPIVDSDATTQRLYVRASKEQLEQIRELLVKMGETSLLTAGDGAGRGLRVIPFSGDTKAALAEIQRVWPQLSKHPLRILQAHESPPRSGLKLPKQKGNAAPKPVLPERPAPAVPKTDDAERGLDKQTSIDRTAAEVIEVKTGAQEGPTEHGASADEKKQQDAAAVTTKDKKNGEEAEGTTPIIVAPGDDKITIMSDDRQAIDQLESLLRALSPPRGSGGRDIMVFPLHSASSTTVAELLQKLFRRGSLDFRDSSGVVVESDQRLNAIVVYGGRSDRAAIERLLKVLDSEDVPESLVANRPSLIPVKNTNAVRIEQVLKDIYKTQLTSGGVKQQIPVPSGASREVAAVIQQINTAATGPLMTLGVDDTTNSIVIMAPGPLVKEVSELVAALDGAALDDSSRGVKIVKLKSTSAQRVKDTLDTIIKDALKRRATSARP
ncbi:MAG: hypothetical protein HY288_00845 [Planctomycetia bacterium]|nr:hypothetical protein [Planctomycetia bacterium]